MQYSSCGCQACGQPGCGPAAPPCCPPTPPKSKPSKPPKACATQGVLLNKIISSERKLYPALCVDLAVTDLPCCAKAPFSLTMVQQSGAQPWWTPLESQGPYARLCLRVYIPVCCQVKDSCGRYFSATSVVEVDACLAPSCPASDCWRHNLVIVPCVRLCSPPVCSQDCVFAVKLEVALELYLTRPEPCFMRAPTPPCPDLPLYPMPCNLTPPCWPQCPTSQDPCGWPRQG